MLLYIVLNKVVYKGIRMTVEKFEAFSLDHVVCECFDVRLGTLVETIKSGVHNMNDLQSQTDAGTACGLCQSCDLDDDEERELHLEEIFEYIKETELCL